MSTTNDKRGLYAKVAEVVADLGYVAKDGKNEFQGYKYTSAEALLAAVRGPLAKRGVVVMPSLTALSERDYTTSKGKTSVITTAHVKFTLVDSETGQSHECEWAGQGDDPADKGLGKALTNAEKTYLRGQFLIPQGDDPEADSRTDERAADRSARNGQSSVVTAEDVESIKAAAKGLTAGQIKLAFAAEGLDGTKPFGSIPQAKAAGLTARLAGVERTS